MAVPIVYTNFVAPAIDAGNLNTVNSVVYTIVGNGTDAPASALDVRNNIGLGTISTQNASSVAITGGSITGASLTATAGALSGAITVSPTTPIAVVNGGTGDTGTAWAAQAINITASGGALANANASIRWKTIGKTVFFSAVGNIIANGTGSGSITLSAFPFTIAAVSQMVVGREAGVSGSVIQGALSGTQMSVFKYDNTYPGANGAVLVLTGVGELA